MTIPATAPPTFDGRRLGQRIATRRIALGWSQQHLADQAGISATTLRLIEAAQRGGQIATLVLIAHALGIQPGILLDDDQDVTG
jgi:transcriptional regulator with XRE-family HTH domain